MRLAATAVLLLVASANGKPLNTSSNGKANGVKKSELKVAQEQLAVAQAQLAAAEAEVAAEGGTIDADGHVVASQDGSYSYPNQNDKNQASLRGSKAKKSPPDGGLVKKLTSGLGLGTGTSKKKAPTKVAKLDSEIDDEEEALTGEMSDLGESLAALDNDIAEGNFDAVKEDEALIESEEAEITGDEAEIEIKEANELVLEENGELEDDEGENEGGDADADAGADEDTTDVAIEDPTYIEEELLDEELDEEASLIDSEEEIVDEALDDVDVKVVALEGDIANGDLEDAEQLANTIENEESEVASIMEDEVAEQYNAVDMLAEEQALEDGKFLYQPD